MLFNNLPLYLATITDDECGVYCVSLVTNPATEVNFVTFDADKPIQKFAIDNKTEHLVSGVIMLCDTPIYRRTESGFEYYITYNRETLKLMAEKMIKDAVGSRVNIQHQNGSNVSDVNLMELFLIDKEKGICPSYFQDVPDGSLIGTYKVNNPDVWEMIENGDVLSFSLEGIFEIQETFNKQDNKNTIQMKIEKIKSMLRKILASFNSVATDKGVLIWDGPDDEDLKEGDAVRGIDEEGNEVSVEDGEYKSEDGKIITIEGGKVISIVDPAAEVSSEGEENSEEQNAEENEEPANEGEGNNEEPAAEDDKDKRIADLEAEIARLEEENGALKARIAELEGEPAAPSAAEQFSKTEDDNKPNAKVDALRKRGYKI